MKNRKGFTLIELLAVISILGILVLMIMPNVIDSFKKSKDRNFISEAQGLYKTAKNTYVMDSARGYRTVIYVKGYLPPNGFYSTELDISSRDGYKYMIRFNENGEIHYFIVEDGEHKIELGDSNNASEVVEFKEIDSDTANLVNNSSSVPTTQEAETCTRGQYLSNGRCYTCPANYYCPAGATSPTACPDGKYSSEGSYAVNQCRDMNISGSINYTTTGPSCASSSTPEPSGYNYLVSGGKTIVQVFGSASNNSTHMVESVTNDEGNYTVRVRVTSTGTSSSVIKNCTYVVTIDDVATSVDVYVNGTKAVYRTSSSGSGGSMY